MSGRIPVNAGSAIDSDVNDPSASYVANDTRNTAQEIANPVTLGGYANAPGAGANGRSQLSGDAFDFYRVALAEGQRIRLFLAEDGATNDLDLSLLRLDGTPVTTRDGTERVMEIDVPDSDIYVIEVSAVSGASNYILTLGQSGESSPTIQTAEPDFIPGEMIVRFEASPEDAGLGANSLGMTALRETDDGATLLGCHEQEERHRALTRLGMGHLIHASADDRSLDPEIQLRRETRRLAKALSRDRSVRAASLNYVRTPHATPSDDLYGLQWHLPLIGLPLAWDNLLALLPAERSAERVIVAVIDTGIAADHADLQGQLVDGYDFIQNATAAKDGNGCDANPDDLGDGIIDNASSYHGTHVGGTIVARTSIQSSGGDSAGVAGAAFDAQVMPLRVLGVGGGTDFDIMQAVRYAARLTNDCDVLPDRRADIINMSLGGPGFNSVFQALINEVRLAGVTVVASAGNDASSAPSYPAAFNGVISVSAVDAEDQLAPYSNFGSTIDVAAPGGDLSNDTNGDGFGDGVLSTWVDPSTQERIYGFAQGTSMAAPHVSAVIALMLDVNPALTPFDIDQLLADGALTEDIGSSTSFGQGRIDAFAAVIAALNAEGGAPPINTPRLAVSPSVLNFGSLAETLNLELINIGGDEAPLVINGIDISTQDGGAWLSVSKENVDANDLGTWSVSVDRGALGNDAIYSGRLAIDSSQNDLDVSVIVQTQTIGSGTDAGHHFVLLVDPDSLESVGELQVDIVDGAYDFSFEGVPSGSYLIVAGSDSDNDNIICDRGESCGAYPARDDLIAVDISGDRSNLNFVTGFSTSFEATSNAGASGGFSRVVRKRLTPNP